MTEFMVGMLVGASIFAVVVAISMAKAAKEIDETETEIFAKEVNKHELES
jgi:energy-converting hydrogenase Eha subunit H